MINQNPTPNNHTPTLSQQIHRLQTLSSTEISDALDACKVTGALLDLKPLAPKMKIVGPAYTVGYLPYEQPPSDFQNAGNYIDTVPAHSVIVIDNQGRDDCTVWGGILTQVALKKEIAGTVIHGAFRDVDCIRSLNYPIYSTSYCMRSGKNRVYKALEQSPLMIQDVIIHPGDLIFADDNGVLVIPIHLVDEITAKAENIQRTEAKIIAAVNAGSSLEQARLDFHYNEPWLEQINK